MPILRARLQGSPNRFTTITGYSELFFLLDGYAVLENAAMPVVGTIDVVNNTYVEQIVADAKAAIDKAAAMGVIDPNRVGVGGHSYGGVHDRESAGALQSVSRRDRRERRLQSHADAVRIPERAAHLLGSHRHLCKDVAVLLRRTRSRIRSC